MMPARFDIVRVEKALAAFGRRGVVESGLAQRTRIVAHLAVAGEPVSGESLGRILGSSRAAVHKHIETLRALGFVIESASGRGHRLVLPFDDLVTGEAVLPFLLCAEAAERTWTAGLPYIYRQSCDSTNRVLRKEIKTEDVAAGLTVVTDHQTEGRGRLDRIWRDRPGEDLMFSALLRPALAPGQAHLLSLAAALAVAETLEIWPGFGARVQVKWPNDVLIDGSKVCGILLEGSMDGDRLHWAIAGIGMNVNSDARVLAAEIEREDAGGLGPRPQPVSLCAVTGARVPRAPLLASLLERLTERWSDLESPEGATSVVSALGERDALAGRPVEVLGGAGRQEHVVAGEAAGFGSEGQLLVRLPSGDIIPVFAGDVTLRSR